MALKAYIGTDFSDSIGIGNNADRHLLPVCAIKEVASMPTPLVCVQSIMVRGRGP